MNRTPQVKDKILILTGQFWSWARIIRINTTTYIFPLFVTEVLHGEYEGESIATPRYIGHTGPNDFIDHALPQTVNS